MNSPQPLPPPVPRSVDALERIVLQSYQQQRREWIGRWIWRGFWLLLALIVFGGSLWRNGSAFFGPHTAIVKLTGVIGAEEETDAALLASLKRAYDNPQVKGIIIEANSPGGSPVVSDVAFTEIRRLKSQHLAVPLVVVADDVCASGCYYIASAADKIYANPSSLVGSIGVISSGFGFTGLMDKLGIERRVKTAGSNKDMGDPFAPENPAQKALWESMLNDIHGHFISAVKTGRGARLKNDPDIFSGRVYTGAQAQEIGLIDGFGNIHTVARDVFHAPKLANYSDQSGLGQGWGKRLGSEFKQGLATLKSVW